MGILFSYKLYIFPCSLWQMNYNLVMTHATKFAQGTVKVKNLNHILNLPIHAFVKYGKAVLLYEVRVQRI
jgi:hypothetical protein